MSPDKYSEIKVGIVLISALAIGGYKFLNVDGIVFVGVVIALLLCGYAAGTNEAYKKYRDMHYSALEDDARKRRKKDEELSKKIHDEFLQDEKENSDNN